MKYVAGGVITDSNAGKIVLLFLIVPQFVRKYRFVAEDVACRIAIRELGKSCE